MRFFSALFLLIAASAEAATPLPTVIDGCFLDQKGKPGLCQTWILKGNQYNPVGGGNLGSVTVERFGPVGATFNQSGPGAMFVYSGNISSNHIEGTLRIGSTTLKWSATFFYPPHGNPALGRHVYVAGSDKASIINTANHSVKTVTLNDPGPQPKSAGAMVVSADSSKAYISNEDSNWKATIFVIDGESGTVANKFPLRSTLIPSGAISLALSGDNSTLYAVGIGKAGAAIIALDTATGAVRATLPISKGYKGNAQVFNPRLIVSGTNLVLDDGTIVDTVVPSGGSPIFGSDGRGLAAFPDGSRICSSGTVETFGNRTVLGPPAVVTIGTKAINSRHGCSAVAPDGTRTYVGSQQLRNEQGTPESNPLFGAVVGSIWGKSVGITSDGKTLYTTGGTGPILYTIDVATNLTSDVIQVFDGPELIGMPPLTAMTSQMLTAATKAKPEGPEAVGTQNASRVVAVIDGKQLDAERALNMIRRADQQTRERYALRLPELLQRMYMREQIAREAVELHLDKQSPWKEQLAEAHRALEQFRPGPGGDTLFRQLQTNWQNNRLHILWVAFFNQADTQDERKALVNRKNEQYKIQVLDDSFFKASH